MQSKQYDSIVGKDIHNMLVDNHVENEIDFIQFSECQISKLQSHCHKLLEEMGITQKKQIATIITKFWLYEAFYGLDYSKFPHIEYVSVNSPTKIILKDINVDSFCEHHFLPAHGFVGVAYTTKQHNIGFGTITRIIDFFAHRPQLQERLTKQIFFTLKHILKIENVFVIMKLKTLLCCIKRVKKQ